jgi:small GTP-binding protein
MSEIDLKIVVLGPTGVGKTCLIHRYCDNTFDTDTLSTIGAGFFTLARTINNTEVNLFLWDTAGEERFRAVAPSLLHGANGLILVYDISHPPPFDDLNIYFEMFLDNVSVDLSVEMPVLLLGNKCDIETDLPEGNVAAWCSQKRIVHSFKVSAKTGENVTEAVEALVRTLIKPVRATDRAAIPLMISPGPESKPCC